MDDMPCMYSMEIISDSVACISAGECCYKTRKEDMARWRPLNLRNLLPITEDMEDKDTRAIRSCGTLGIGLGEDILYPLQIVLTQIYREALSVQGVTGCDWSP